MGSIAMSAPPPALLLLLLLGLAAASLPDTRSKEEKFYINSLEDAIEDFTQSIYVDLATKSGDENFVFSPLSLHSAMSLLFLGSTHDKQGFSETADELRVALGRVNSKPVLTQAYKLLVSHYLTQPSLLYGNHIWLGADFALQPEFEEMVKTKFLSGISNTDFRTKEAVGIVNNWVSNVTQGQIDSLVDEFAPNTKLFLANALFFKDSWLSPFKDTDAKGNPLKLDFSLVSDEVVEVPMIRQISEKLVYGELNLKGKLYKVVSIPYANENFEMQIIIPANKNQKLKLLEDELQLLVAKDIESVSNDAEKFNLFKVVKNESSFNYIEDVSIRMPTFKIRHKFNAADSFNQLGVEKVFTPIAELDRMVTGGPIGVGKILHEAVVEVNKEGTEAAAATGLELVLFSGGFGEQASITLDRPFIFIVQDKLNNLPVLVGRVMNPTRP